MKSIAIIVGSNRTNRICLDIAEWVKKQMTHSDLKLTIVDLEKVNLPFLDEPEKPALHRYQHEHTKRWSELISNFDGFVLVFPQYNWGYPAVLKNALDFLYDEWHDKPVSIICYGSHGGFQASLAIKLVIQGLGMIGMATNPALNISDEMFNGQGQFINLDEAFKSNGPNMQALSAEFVRL